MPSSEALFLSTPAATQNRAIQDNASTPHFIHRYPFAPAGGAINQQPVFPISLSAKSIGANYRRSENTKSPDFPAGFNSLGSGGHSTAGFYTSPDTGPMVSNNFHLGLSPRVNHAVLPALTQQSFDRDLPSFDGLFSPEANYSSLPTSHVRDDLILSSPFHSAHIYECPSWTKLMISFSITQICDPDGIPGSHLGIPWDPRKVISLRSKLKFSKYARHRSAFAFEQSQFHVLIFQSPVCDFHFDMSHSHFNLRVTHVSVSSLGVPTLFMQLDFCFNPQCHFQLLSLWGPSPPIALPDDCDASSQSAFGLHPLAFGVPVSSSPTLSVTNPSYDPTFNPRNIYCANFPICLQLSTYT